MASVYIPCLNVDAPDTGGGLSVGIGVGAGSGGDGLTPTPAIEISHPDSPFTLKIIPVYPYITLGINWKFWEDLFGLGETRIQREKAQIQDVYTPIFQFAKEGYGFPLRDNHALQMSSEYVEQMFREDEFKARSAPGMYQAALPLAQSVFVDDTPSEGQRKRIVNQFLANAHINEWPTNAWVILWNGILEAADPACRNDQARFMRNPMLMDAVARYAVLLQYMPLANFVGAVAESKFNDRNGKRVMRLWLQDPRLVEGIVTQQPYPDWAVPYESTGPDGQPPSNPYASQQIADREPIQQLWQGVTYQRPWYPDLIYLSDRGLISPTLEIPPAEPPPLEPGEPIPPPYPDGNQTPVPPPDQEPTPWPDQPDCPPYEPPPGEQPPPTYPGPQPDPETGCPSPCQEQIDYLLEQMRIVNNYIHLGILPRLDNLDIWITDVERRVPGPQPDLPAAEFPPWLPNVPDDPGDVVTIPPVEEPPGEEPPPELIVDEECQNKLLALCDDELFCLKVRDCERPLECKEVPLCDETGGPWGAMAECWVLANAPTEGSMLGVMQGQVYPQTIGDALLNSFKASAATILGGQGSGTGQGIGVDIRTWEGRYVTLAATYGDRFMEAVKSEDAVPQPYPGMTWDIQTPIMTDPNNPIDASLKVRQPALRAGEIDPCEEVL